MISSTVARSALASLALLVLLGGNAAYASPTTQDLSMTVTGTVVNLGSQHYNVHGGALLGAVVSGLTFGPSARVDYSIDAHVTALSAQGNAQIHIDGRTTDNLKAAADIDVNIYDMVEMAVPLGCTTSCNSALPVFFIGAATGHVNVEQARPVQIATTILLESPYFSPWGGPISMTSTDESIVIATTYEHGTIEWQGSTSAGSITGTLGTTAVSGDFNLVSHETEDLVAGTANDTGQVSLTNMYPAYLDSAGHAPPGPESLGLSGNSVIPTPGSTACAVEAGIFGTPCTSDCTSYLASMGLPALPGTCTSTGFQSDGKLTLNDGHISISGTYSTTWSNPALWCVSTISATVTQR